MDFYEYKDVFAVEAREHIQSLNENLLQFEQTPADRELVAEMFRAAHSLKGMAGTMGYTQLADFTHHMENLLDALRNEEIAPSQELINTLFDSVDMLELILEEVISFDTVHTDTTAMKERLAEILAGSLAQPKAAEAAEAGQAEPIPSRQAGEAEVQLTLNEYDRELLKEAAARNYNVYWITVIIRQDVLMKSVRAYTVFQALEKLGTVVKSEPSAEDIDEEHFEDRFAVLIFTRQSLPEVREAILNIPEILDVIVSEVTVEDAESLPPRTPEITAGKERADQAVRRAGDGRSRVVEKYVRVETERLDQLNNLVGELVISRTQVMELAKQLEDGHSRAVLPRWTG